MIALADSYDNFTGYNPFWEPLGYPNTATYGKTFPRAYREISS